MRVRRAFSPGWAVACAGLVALSSPLAEPAADGPGWVPVGDARLRSDLQMLVDGDVLRLPLSTWPLPLSDVRRAVENAQSRSAVPKGLLPTYERVERWLTDATARGGVRSLAVRGGRAAKLREFGAIAREDLEVEASQALRSDAWSAAASVTVVSDASDGKTARLDGSHFTGQLGNWQIGAAALDRFWGPGFDSSLILSNAARPIPALVVDRAISSPFESRWLAWAGHWRITGLLGRMESGREDIDRPYFFGLRVTLQPLPWAELGIARSAQLCGDGRRCTLRTFGDMLVGKDLVGVGGNVSDVDQPGNQLAGFDLRVRSPWPRVPVALYWQDIGEDQVNYRPTDRLVQYGLESWAALADGSTLRAQLEYAYTACQARTDPPVFDCAYTNNLYDADGYRYRGLPVAHTTDADSESIAGVLRWTRQSGVEWSLRLRDADLNRGGAFDPNHSLTPSPATLKTAEVGVRGALWGGDIEARIGVEQTRGPAGVRDERATGIVSWRRTFD
jgi:hypothetical protein